MKSYTDLEQSKKLAEILPLESADMHSEAVDDEGDMVFIIVGGLGDKTKSNYGSPVWSLAALLSVLPKEYTNSKNQVCTLHIDIVDSETPYLMWYANPEHEGSIVEIKTEEYSNLVDACYEMVIKLHEQNII